MIVTFILEVRPLEDVAPPPSAPHAELPHTASRHHCHRPLPRLTPPLFQIITDNVTLISLYTSTAPRVGRAAAVHLHAAARKTTAGDFYMSQAQFSMNGRLRGDPGVFFFFLSYLQPSALNHRNGHYRPYHAGSGVAGPRGRKDGGRTRRLQTWGKVQFGRGSGGGGGGSGGGPVSRKLPFSLHADFQTIISFLHLKCHAVWEEEEEKEEEMNI
ncbi:hypothetical protein E2C01_093184 [Portunus trituberculatus]|uniref:Uncharacterized protein n=1 Tax=Portunus trituberculatus TaxID=210409 RepID=A0A5B7JXF7_PORTR|nr:hypothetical protein [Portunus trituberculatus]